MSASALSLANGSGAIDFSDAGFAVYGTDNRVMDGAVMTMRAGDATSDGSVNAADRADTWNFRNQSGYLLSDVDLSGTCNAADRAITWNNRNASAQLP